MDTTDAELLGRCRNGDHAAWETVVRRHHQRIYNFAYRFSGKFDDAEDLTQEIFLKVYKTLHTFNSELGAFETWMMRLGRNCIIDHYRRMKMERSRTDSLDGEHEQVAETGNRFANPAEALDHRELSERVHAALVRLSEDLREVLILRDLEGFAYEEIVDIIKVPIGTVKSRINRGRLEMAKILKRI
ncbi:MAG TPA: sigma-70 family RNA polymerase sigma factor [Terriglobia bacterium]|nr:sigma-70 family RNA polymerase sigma factor [Terriglobia bacterium]